MIYGVMGIFAVLLWSLALFSTRVLFDLGFETNTITLLRFGIAALIMRLVLPAAKRKITIGNGDRRYFVMLALGGITLFYFFENSGVRYTTISNTALIIATIPLFTLLSGHFFFHKKMCAANYIGLPLGLAGTAILFIKDILHGSALHIKGDIMVLGSVALWVVYSFAYRKISHKYNPAFITYTSFVWGSLFLIPVALLEASSYSQMQINLSAILNVLFLAIFPSYIAYLLWNISIQRIGIKITSNFVLLNPVFSIALGVVFLHEPFSINLVLSTVAILAGAYFSSVSSSGNHY